MAQIHTLAYAVRFRLVLRYLSQIALVLAALEVVPLVVSLWFAEYTLTVAQAVVVGILLAAGLPSIFVTTADDVQANEALVVTALAFTVAPLLLSYPLVQAGLPVVDAVFEAVSGITTTGLSTLATVEDLPRTILFSRAWMQWYGGLGIVVLSVALLLGHGLVAKRLVTSETGIDNLVTTTKIHARRILAAYAALTIVGIAAVLLTGAGAFEAVTHVLAAISTGGFSTFDRSLLGFDSWAPRAILMVVAFCGALALPLYYDVQRAGVRKLAADPEVKGLLVGTLVAFGLLGLALWIGGHLRGVNLAAHALLVGVSAQTGTGFTTLGGDELDPMAKGVLLGHMLVGGSVGSTAGGIKVWRFLILFAVIRLAIHRVSMPPHAVADIRLGGQRVDEADVHRALMIVGLFACVIFASWLAFLAHGHDPLNALFEVVSATATVGLSAGVAGPALDPALKLVLCADMLVGRLEVFAFLVLLYPRTWAAKRTEAT